MPLSSIIHSINLFDIILTRYSIQMMNNRTSGTFFVLKQGQVSLLVSVARMPHLSLSEQVVDQNSCRFSFGQSTATSSAV